MRAGNFTPAGIDDLAHDHIVLRRLTVFGYTEGEAVEQPAKMQQLSALQLRFIARAWQATEHRAQSGLEPSKRSPPAR